MASTWDTAIISGGQSGGVYYNDWLTFEACVCFWPDDPSYAQQLGAMEFRGEVQQLATSYRRYYKSPHVRASGDDTLLSYADTGMFRAGVEIETSCAPGWHFHLHSRPTSLLLLARPTLCGWMCSWELYDGACVTSCSAPGRGWMRGTRRASIRCPSSTVLRW